jgi:16S rRNA processing protein RimM
MIKKENCYKIGRIGKAHGVKGEVSFQFTDDVFDRTETDYLILEVDGLLVPFFMEEYRFRSDNIALVKFCDIDTQQRASELTNCDVWFPRSLTPDDEEVPSLASLVGFDLVEANGMGVVGRIAAIDDSTVNLLFELEDGTLIPASDDLIEDIDTANRKIIMNIPEGLLALR